MPARLMSVLDAVPAVITYCDSELRVQFANAYAVAWLGKTCRADLLGAKFEDLLPPDVFAANLPHALAALTGSPQLFQRSFIDSQGQQHHTQASYTPVGEPDSITGFYIHVTDITDRVESEVALREQARLLAEMSERDRISRDFNDVITRRLFAVSLMLCAALQDDSSPHRRIESAVTEIDATLVELRTQLFRTVSESADSNPAASPTADTADEPGLAGSDS